MGKLHLPMLTAEVKPTLAESLDTIQAVPLCGRQLNNHRGARAQDSVNAKMAITVEEYLVELSRGNACKHCGRVAGILPKLVRVSRDTDNEESDSDE